jgi:hypothetical protein
MTQAHRPRGGKLFSGNSSCTDEVPPSGKETRMSDASTAPTGHGSSSLPGVNVESYNVEIKDEDGFVGDRARQGAFRDFLEEWRKIVRQTGTDPLGEKSSDNLAKKTIDSALADGDHVAAGIVQSAIEDYAQELAAVVRRFLKLKAWKEVERIALGGGFRATRVGEIAIGRAGAILKAEKVAVDLVPTHNNPDDAGLIGSVHLAPAALLKGRDAILAADIGGTNIRAGVVKLGSERDFSKASVWKLKKWRHRDEKNVGRNQAIDKLVEMLDEFIGLAAKEKFDLAPFVGVGCPGIIADDGTIERGAHNLPGQWDNEKFNLPRSLTEKIGKIDKRETTVVLHNDAVVQGLSELPFMRDVDRWGALTIGTGLGNALFTNRDEVE